MRTKAHLAVLIAMAALISSCGKDDNTNGTASVGRAEETHAVSRCEAAWTKLVETTKVGTISTYQITTRSDTPGSLPVLTKSERKDTILEVTPEQVTHQSATREQTVTVTLKKAEFIQTCQAPVSAPEGSRAELVEEKDESVTVAAGRFASRYHKTKVTNAAAGEVLHETWTSKDDSSRLLKTATVSTTIEGTDETTTTITTELVKIELP